MAAETKINKIEKLKKDNGEFKTEGFEGKEIIQFAPVEFDSIGKVMRIDSAKLSKLISDEFRTVFHDFYGTKLIFLGENKFKVELYFKNNPEPVREGKIKNLEHVLGDSVKEDNFYSRKLAMNNIASGKKYLLNNETKTLLSKFMYGGREQNLSTNKAWKDKITDVHLNNTTGMYYTNADDTYTVVTGIDLNVLLKNIFGNTIVTSTVKSEDGDINKTEDAQYTVNFGGWYMGSPNSTFILNITQFAPEKLVRKNLEENPQIYNMSALSDVR